MNNRFFEEQLSIFLTVSCGIIKTNNRDFETKIKFKIKIKKFYLKVVISLKQKLLMINAYFSRIIWTTQILQRRRVKNKEKQNEKF